MHRIFAFCAMKMEIYNLLWWKLNVCGAPQKRNTTNDFVVCAKALPTEFNVYKSQERQVNALQALHEWQR